MQWNISHKKEWIYRDIDGPRRECHKSEVSQKRETQIFHIRSYKWDLEKWYRWTYLQSRNRDTDAENKHMDTKGGKVGWDELGNWDSHIYTTIVKSMTNENLLHSTRNSTTQCSVVSWMRRKSKREGIYAYVWLIHFDVQKKIAQHCKATVLQ